MELQQPIQQNKLITSNATIDDYVLVKRVRGGDIAAFELIMRRHNQRLFRLARSIVREDDEAMDVVQDTYIKAFYQLEQFNGPVGFATWLSRITSNEAKMRLRKSNRLLYVLDEPDYELDEMKSTDQQPAERLATQQLRKLLEEAIDSLPVNYSCVYMMRAIQQLSTQETAMSLDISEDLVKTRYLRAKRILKEKFEYYLDQTGLTVHEFAGHRCDAIVKAVLMKI
jgi:RNA polymerase sigma-70 factor (ECF subfamily)